MGGVTPRGINNDGHVSGWYFDGHLQGFLKKNGRVFALNVPNSLFTEAVGIDDADQVVGDYRGVDGNFHGFRYADGNYVSFDFPGSQDTGASGINNLAQIVGCHSLCGHGFLYNLASSAFTAIDVPGAVTTQASDINDLGQIVGAYSTDNVTLRGFLYDGISFTSIDAPGAFITNIYGINNLGQIVGFFVVERSPGVFEDHAFLATR